MGNDDAATTARQLKRNSASEPILRTLAFLTPTEAAGVLKVSLSWLAKARLAGDGPPFVQIGRTIRYSEAALMQWLKSRQRLSTSEQ